MTYQVNAKVQVSVRVSPELAERLAAYCIRERINRNEAIVRAVEKFLEADERSRSKKVAASS